MSTSPDTLALLFGRGGSVGLPGKNVSRILGRPSLHYPLLAASALAGDMLQDLYLSTDSEEIRSLAAPFSPRLIARPPALATNEALLEDTIVHAFEHVEHQVAAPPAFYLILLCNAVTVMPDRIRDAHQLLLS